MKTNNSPFRVGTLLDRLRDQLLGDSRSLTYEGATATLTLPGTESVDVIVRELVRCCRAALDRSTQSLLDREKTEQAANRLDVTIQIADHDRAVRLQNHLDDMDLAQQLSQDLTKYAIDRQRYVVYGGRVMVTAVNVQEMPGSTDTTIVAHWRRDRDAGREKKAPSLAEQVAANKPADASVMGSGKKTQHAGEGILEPFTLWLRDGDKDPVGCDVGTPFYFGRNCQGSQVDVPFGEQDLVSGDHFSILYLQNEGFVLRDNKSTNGTMVVRGDDAVRLQTPASRRETEYARELRLRAGDVIRLEAGAPGSRRVLQFAFGLGGFSLQQVKWADRMAERGIHWEAARDLVLRPIRSPGSPQEQYTLLIGDNYLGSALTGGLWTSYRRDDENFRGGRALAAIHNFGRCTLAWLAPDVHASLNGASLTTDASVGVPNDSELQFGGGEAPAMRVQFQWQEDDGRGSA